MTMNIERKKKERKLFIIVSPQDTQHITKNIYIHSFKNAFGHSKEL